MDQNFYKDLLDALADGVYFVDLDRNVTFWNKAAERLTGFRAQEVVGKSCADEVLRHVDAHGTQLCLKGCPLAKTLRDGEVREAEVFLHHKQGHRIPVRIRSSPMRDDDGTIIGAVEIFSDNTKQVDVLNEIEALRKEVLRDELTGIGNRRFAEMTLQRYDLTLKDCNGCFAVIFVDLDHFKQVNDSWGHEAGDKLLRMVARTLTNGLRALDVACRWGGEEFVILLPNVTRQAVVVLAERLRMLIENSWLDYKGEQLRVTASLGCAVAREGESTASVVSRADRLMYKSKDADRNCVHMDAVYSAEDFLT